MTGEPYATMVADHAVRVSTGHYRLLQRLFRFDMASCLGASSLVSSWRRNAPIVREHRV